MSVLTYIRNGWKGYRKEKSYYEHQKSGEYGDGTPRSFPAQQGFAGGHLYSRGFAPRRPRFARRPQWLAVYRRGHPLHVLCRGVPTDSALRPMRPLPSLAPLRVG